MNGSQTKSKETKEIDQFRVYTQLFLVDSRLGGYSHRERCRAPDANKKYSLLTCSAEASGGALAMVTRAPPKVMAVVAGATSGSNGGGGAVVSARRASALSPSSVRLPVSGGRVAPREESLQMSTQ